MATFPATEPPLGLGSLAPFLSAADCCLMPRRSGEGGNAQYDMVHAQARHVLDNAGGAHLPSPRRARHGGYIPPRPPRRRRSSRLTHHVSSSAPGNSDFAARTLPIHLAEIMTRPHLGRRRASVFCALRVNRTDCKRCKNRVLWGKHDSLVCVLHGNWL